MSTSKVPHALTAFLAVQIALAKVGINKGSKNASQGFQFRGIDDVMYYLSPLLAEQSLIISPRVISYRTDSKVNEKGKFVGFAYVHMQYVFTSAVDGSQHLVEAVGEGIDTADKSTGKASSYAFKEAILKGFCVPVEGNLDPDFDSPETTAARPAAPRAQAEVPEGTKVAPAAEKALGSEDAAPSLEAALVRLVTKESNREKLRQKLLQAWGVMTLDQIPEERVPEAIQQAEAFVKAVAAKKAQGK